MIREDSGTVKGESLLSNLSHFSDKNVSASKNVMIRPVENTIATAGNGIY
jgi:hypothetical protein